MNRFVSVMSLGLAIAIAPAAIAQTSATAPYNPNTGTYGATTGTYEFTLGGSGFANKELDNSGGGFSFSIGKYVNDMLLVSVRQAVNYTNPNNGGRAYSGSTLVAVDHHFGTGQIRPYVGANFGGIYGDNVKDSLSAGLEAGVKYYVQPRTFVFAQAQYEWLFNRGKDINKHFSNGQYIWNLGVGFHF